MIFGEIILFLCLLFGTLFFAKQSRWYSTINFGFYGLTIGLGLLAANALCDVLIIGPTVLFPDYMLPEQIARKWDIFGYVPGILFVVVGMVLFLPAIARISKMLESHELSKQELLSHTDALHMAKIRAEDAEKVLFEALESISEAFIIFDENDKVVAFNSQYRDLFASVGDILKPGVCFEVLIRHQAKLLGVFEAGDEFEDWIARRLEEHRNPTGFKEQVFENGQVYRLTEVKTPSGGTVAIRTNITDLRNREKALRLINERLQEAQSVAHIGHWSYDVRNDRHDWSEECSRIMGYDPNTLVISTAAYLERVHPEDIDRMRALVKWSQENEENYQIVYRMVHPGGHIVHVREIGRVQKDENGETEFFRGTLQDVTSQHEAEMELVEAKMRAEEGTKAKSLFLANMSHELRTPLNAIIGFAEVITKEIFGPVQNDKYSEYSENILASGQHLLSLINDILDFSRLEADKYELEEEDVSLSEVADWAQLLLAPKAAEKQITYSCDVPDDLILLGDERKLKQVLLNLLNNAIKFTPKGGNIKVFAKADAAGNYSLFVEDNGIGIEERELESVMRPFVRTMNSVTRSIEGTGLGLPLSKSIVELHEGELLIKSTINVGTTVEVKLPKNRFKQFAKSA